VKSSESENRVHFHEKALLRGCNFCLYHYNQDTLEEINVFKSTDDDDSGDDDEN